MRGWSIPVVLVFAAACSSDDRNGPGVPPDVPASLGSTTLDGAIALTWSDNSYVVRPRQLPELPDLQHHLQPRPGPLRHQLPAGGNHRGPGVRRRRAHQRRAALLHRDGGERGRVRERSLAAAVGHAPSRHAEHGAVRVPVPVGGERLPLLGRSQRRWRRAGSGAGPRAFGLRRRHRLRGRSRRRRRPVPHPGARRDGRGVLRREQPGRGSHDDRLRRRPHVPPPRASWPFRGMATSSRWTAATASSATARCGSPTWGRTS